MDPGARSARFFKDFDVLAPKIQNFRCPTGPCRVVVLTPGFPHRCVGPDPGHLWHICGLWLARAIVATICGTKRPFLNGETSCSRCMAWKSGGGEYYASGGDHYDIVSLTDGQESKVKHFHCHSGCSGSRHPLTSMIRKSERRVS